MKARELIRKSSYGPDQLKVIFEAFDGAWDHLAPSVGTDPVAIEAARVKLANIILNLAKDRSDRPEWLKAAALRVMASS